ncbi:MAG: prepilin-type N-terminal cleavage/methylation domain-containing protein [Fidelibacterota bacterium]
MTHDNKKITNTNSSEGFTLIEVLVSVALLGLVVLLMGGIFSFLNQPTLLHRSKIILHANEQFEGLVAGTLKPDDIEPLYKRLLFESQVDSFGGLVTFRLDIKKRRSEKTIYQLRTYRVYRE